MNKLTRTILQQIQNLQNIQCYQWDHSRNLPIPISTGIGDVAFGALNLAVSVYGPDSPQAEAVKQTRQRLSSNPGSREAAAIADELKGVLQAIESDIKAGLVGSLEVRLQSEVLGDFVTLAKHALDEGQKDVAAVLASAALEDSLKKYAVANGLQVQDKVMQEVVAALKTKGLISGAQKGLVDAFPKIRDHAMHANWDKIAPEDVRSVIGFVEQFLLTKFSAINPTAEASVDQKTT